MWFIFWLCFLFTKISNIQRGYYKYSPLEDVLHLALKIETQLKRKDGARRSHSPNDYNNHHGREKIKRNMINILPIITKNLYHLKRLIRTKVKWKRKENKRKRKRKKKCKLPLKCYLPTKRDSQSKLATLLLFLSSKPKREKNIKKGRINFSKLRVAS